jgi:hypothetical protein
MDGEQGTPKGSTSWVARLGAWQPFTGAGLGAFARTNGTRLLLFHLASSILTAAALMWSLQLAWVPVIREAIERLPNSGSEIRQGRLIWPGDPESLLAERPELALAIDAGEGPGLGQSADLQIELHPDSAHLRGILGHLKVPYPTGLELPLDRTRALAAWGAWRPPFLALAGGATLLATLLGGWTLAALHAPVLAFMGWISRRDLSLVSAWKLGLASLFTAGLVFDVSLLLYASHWIRLPALAGFLPICLLTAWIAMLRGVACLPAPAKEPQSGAPNPFGGEPRNDTQRSEAKTRNPFG